MTNGGKYDPQAERWTETAYADAPTYLRERVERIARIGPRLASGDTVLDLACGDGGLADFLPAGVRYLGVDASSAMVAAARSHGRDAVCADLNDYTPPERVAVTTCFRAIYYARDRTAFFAHVRSYTEKKLVFDLNPRQYSLADVRTDAIAAGFTRFELEPFFVPQRHAVAPLLGRALRLLEGNRRAASAVLRARFTYVCAAS